MRRAVKRRAGLADSHGVVTCTFGYTGAAEPFTVPLGVTSLDVEIKRRSDPTQAGDKN